MVGLLYVVKFHQSLHRSSLEMLGCSAKNVALGLIKMFLFYQNKNWKTVL